MAQILTSVNALTPKGCPCLPEKIVLTLASPVNEPLGHTILLRWKNKNDPD